MVFNRGMTAMSWQTDSLVPDHMVIMRASVLVPRTSGLSPSTVFLQPYSRQYSPVSMAYHSSNATIDLPLTGKLSKGGLSSDFQYPRYAQCS